MHDISHRSEPPGDWQQALAALPLESPPADSWKRIASRLPARVRPSARLRRWPVALAAAATLTAVAIIPVLWRSPPEPAAPVATTPANPQPSPSSGAVSETPIAVASETLPPAAAVSGLSTGNTPDAPATTVAATIKAARPPTQRSMRDTAGDAATSASAPTSPTSPAAPPTLESLYVESAHLESLLTQIQDDRVASGPAMAMAGALEDRIAAIDHALSQPGNDDGQQRELWQQRVDALRQLAGLEGTQRWLAASGNAAGDGSRIY